MSAPHDHDPILDMLPRGADGDSLYRRDANRWVDDELALARIVGLLTERAIAEEAARLNAIIDAQRPPAPPS